MEELYLLLVVVMAVEVTILQHKVDLILLADQADLEAVVLKYQREHLADLEMLEVIVQVKEIMQEMVVDLLVLTPEAAEAEAQLQLVELEAIPDNLVLVVLEQQLVLQDHL
jgi:hypothetical protein